jgi:D-sedoheptulose 7-phosphate isomerase
VENNQIIHELTERHPRLLPVKNEIGKAAELLVSCFRKGGKLLVCGNGGSSSDSDHIAGEMMKGFEKRRLIAEKSVNALVASGGERGRYLSEKLQKGLPAISLSAHTGLITAIANDTDADLIFAQQVMGYGKPGDVLMALSTSGNSRNVIDAIITAKAIGMTVIGLTGDSGGQMGQFCDILIAVSSNGTAYTQELHLPVYHAICRLVESEIFGEENA